MLEQLLKELGSFNPSVRRRAIVKAGKLSPDQLIELISMEHSHERRSRPYLWAAMLAYITLFVVVVLTVAQRPDYDSRMMRSLLYMFLLSPLPLALIPSLTRRSINAIATKMDDPACVGAVLMLLATSVQVNEGRDSRTNLRSVLTRLLPHVTPEQARSWSDVQRRALILPLDFLAYSENRSSTRCLAARIYAKSCENAVILLKALEQIGDGRELETVRAIAALKPHTAQEEHLRSAALECIPYLETLASEKDRVKTLLRASDAPSMHTAETLLRSATSRESNATGEQLLRPSVDGQ